MDAAFSWNKQRRTFSHSHLVFCLTSFRSPKVTIKRKSLQRATFIMLGQPRDHPVFQRDSMITRQKASRMFTPDTSKSTLVASNIQTDERAIQRLCIKYEQQLIKYARVYISCETRRPRAYSNIYLYTYNFFR